MLKKSLLLSVGGIIFVIGMILFPLPVPFGLPTMIVGLAIMFRASDKVKRRVIRWTDKNHHTRMAWLRFKDYRRRKKLAQADKLS
jgi:hypothetical protein